MEQTPQVVLCQGNHVVYTLAPQRADKSFAQGIGLGTLCWGFQDAQTQVAYTLVELCRENAVPVMEQEAIGMLSRKSFAQLLERPWRCGMGCHLDVEDTPCGVFHEHKHIEEAKRGRDHHAKVTGNDCRGMISDERSPVLGRHAVPLTTVEMRRHVFPHGPG